MPLPATRPHTAAAALALLGAATAPAAAAAQPTLTLNPGDAVANNTVIADGTTVNVNGGSIGLGVDLSNGVLNINGGSVALGATGIGTGFTNTNNTIALNGGQVGGFFQVIGSQFTLGGGSIESFGLFADSTVNVTGGTVTRFPDIINGTVNLSGGNVFAARVFDGGTLNVFGTDFALDDVPVDNLTLGEALTIDTRNVTLTATLADGSFFETDLNPAFGGFFSPNPDGAATDATITLTLVPEPAALLVLTGAAPLLGRRRRRA